MPFIGAIITAEWHVETVAHVEVIPERVWHVIQAHECRVMMNANINIK